MCKGGTRTIVYTCTSRRRTYNTRTTTCLSPFTPFPLTCLCRLTIFISPQRHPLCITATQPLCVCNTAFRKKLNPISICIQTIITAIINTCSSRRFQCFSMTDIYFICRTAIGISPTVIRRCIILKIHIVTVCIRITIIAAIICRGICRTCNYRQFQPDD